MELLFEILLQFSERLVRASDREEIRWHCLSELDRIQTAVSFYIIFIPIVRDSQFSLKLQNIICSGGDKLIYYLNETTALV